jgi:histidinol-phosphatase (PHP family)
MIIADYHVHSDFSSDSKAPMEQMIEEAIRLRLKKLCFTDHMDFDYPQVSNYNFTFDSKAYTTKLNELKEQYHKQIEILTGIELGLQPHLSDRLSDLLDSYPFDFAIGSSHVVNHTDPYFPEYWENRTKEEGIRLYFESIIENCKSFQGFNVYGHIDYIIRYVPGQEVTKATYSYLDYADLLDEVLKTIISYGKGIEINTAGFKYGLGHAHPKPEVLKRYKELGGELITIGSDAHKPEHLAYDFNLVPELLKELGFRYYATFVKGKPLFEKL